MSIIHISAHEQRGVLLQPEEAGGTRSIVQRLAAASCLSTIVDAGSIIDLTPNYVPDIDQTTVLVCETPEAAKIYTWRYNPRLDPPNVLSYIDRSLAPTQPPDQTLDIKQGEPFLYATSIGEAGQLLVHDFVARLVLPDGPPHLMG